MHHFRTIRASVSKVLNLFVILLVSTFFLTFIQPANAVEIEYIQNIIDRGFIRVGIPPYNTPPFYYIDEKSNELAGYDIEIAKNFAERLGVKIEFDRKSKSYNDLVRRAGANEVDFAIGKLGTTYKRMKNAHPHSYMNFRHSLLANRKTLTSLQGNLPIEKLAKVVLDSDLRIGFIADSAYSTFAGNLFPNSIKFGFEDWSKAKIALFNNEIDAIYRDSTEIKKIVYQEPSISIEYVPVLFDDMIDTKSIYISTLGNVEMGSILDFYLTRSVKVKSDVDIMDEYESYYKPSR
jgi:polar amino acid transport system substrate-binding protein